MRDILISGATGFLGSNLIELLSKKIRSFIFGKKTKYE